MQFCDTLQLLRVLSGTTVLNPALIPYPERVHLFVLPQKSGLRRYLTPQIPPKKVILASEALEASVCAMPGLEFTCRKHAYH